MEAMVEYGRTSLHWARNFEYGNVVVVVVAYAAAIDANIVRDDGHSL